MGTGVHTPGDQCDVLVAMNPAALKQNCRYVKDGGVIIVDIDSFKQADLDKAKFTTTDPFGELGIRAQVLEVPVTTLTKAALADSPRQQERAEMPQYILSGLVCWLFDRPLPAAVHFLQKKFAKKPTIFEANEKVIHAGYDYGSNIHATVSTYRIESEPARKGVYTDINGNTATAWGLIMASEKSGHPSFWAAIP